MGKVGLRFKCTFDATFFRSLLSPGELYLFKVVRLAVVVSYGRLLVLMSFSTEPVSLPALYSRTVELN